MVEDVWQEVALNYELQVTMKQKRALKNDFEARKNITGCKTEEKGTSYPPQKGPLH
jgi:hypothetical protein